MSEEKKKSALALRKVVGGLGEEPETWGDWVDGLSDSVEPLVEELQAPVQLDVVFHIPGPLVSNDFQGVRTGKYFKEDNVLMVQAAVPEGEGLDRWQVLVGLLADAVNAAQEHVRKWKIAEGLPELQAVVEQVQAMDPPAEEHLRKWRIEDVMPGLQAMMEESQAMDPLAEGSDIVWGKP